MLLEEIKEVLEEAINVDPAKVVPDARLKEDLEIDSLSAVELSLELETRFDITIDDEELANLVTVQDIIDIVDAKK